MKKYILFILSFLMICSCNTSVNSSSSSVSSSSSGINENEQNLNRLVEFINETLIPAYRRIDVSAKEEISYISYWDNFTESSILKDITIIDENNNYYKGSHYFLFDETTRELISESYRDLIVVDSKIYKDYYALPSGNKEKTQAILSDEEEIKRYQNSCNNTKNNRLKFTLSQLFTLNNGTIIGENSLKRKGKISFLKETPEMIEFIIESDEYIEECYSVLPEDKSGPWYVSVLEYTHGIINKKTLSFDFKRKVFNNNEGYTNASAEEYKWSLNNLINEPENVSDYEVVDHLDVYFY